MNDLNNLVNVASIVGGFATAAAAAFAIVGIPLVIFQVKATRAIQREATAKQLYRQYLSDCVERPDLVQPDLKRIEKDERMIQYELFVAHMLFSLEEIVTNVDSEEWKDVAKGQLRRHQKYLNSPRFAKKRAYYHKSLVRLMDEVSADEE